MHFWAPDRTCCCGLAGLATGGGLSGPESLSWVCSTSSGESGVLGLSCGGGDWRDWGEAEPPRGDTDPRDDFEPSSWGELGEPADFASSGPALSRDESESILFKWKRKVLPPL